MLLVGIDGLEWRLALPLIQQGRMPQLERLMRAGTFGLLETFQPTWSPVIWTSVATGKDRLGHGIVNFVSPRRELFNRCDRQTKAIWNLFTEAGRTTHCYGWWMTYPVESIAGVMVAQTHSMEQVDIESGRNVWKGTLRHGVDGQVHPESAKNRVMDRLEAVESKLDGLLEQVFGVSREPDDELSRRLWNNARWSFRADTAYHDVALEFLRDEVEMPDLTLVYFGCTDVVGHFFLRYLQPQLYEHPPSDEELEQFGEVVLDAYCYVDGMLGDLIETAGPETTVIVVSDHGMHPVNRKGSFDVNEPGVWLNSGDHQDAPPGVIVAAGPHVRRAAVDPRTVRFEDLPRVGSVLDLTPTLLAMERIPLGEDLEGKVLRELFEPEFEIERQPPPVPTHDDEAFFESQRNPFPNSADSRAWLRQLQQLGYLREETQAHGAVEDDGDGERRSEGETP